MAPLTSLLGIYSWKIRETHCAQNHGVKTKPEIRQNMKAFLRDPPWVPSCSPPPGESSRPHPEDLPAHVGYPLLLQGVPFGVLDQVGDRAGAAELHHQLHTDTSSRVTTPSRMLYFGKTIYLKLKELII